MTIAKLKIQTTICYSLLWIHREKKSFHIKYLVQNKPNELQFNAQQSHLNYILSPLCSFLVKSPYWPSAANATCIITCSWLGRLVHPNPARHLADHFLIYSVHSFSVFYAFSFLNPSSFYGLRNGTFTWLRIWLFENSLPQEIYFHSLPAFLLAMEKINLCLELRRGRIKLHFFFLVTETTVS